MELKARDEMILRVKGAQDNLELLPDADAKQKSAKLLAIEQWQSTLDQLNSNPPPGRMTIRISAQITRWKGTPADIEVRAGDTLVIPKRPGYVMVTGQVFNPTAVSFRPGRSAKWYLGQSGGPTQVADKKAIFVIRADGSVMDAKQSLRAAKVFSARRCNAVLTPWSSRKRRAGRRVACAIQRFTAQRAGGLRGHCQHDLYRVALLMCEA